LHDANCRALPSTASAARRRRPGKKVGMICRLRQLRALAPGQLQMICCQGRDEPTAFGTPTMQETSSTRTPTSETTQAPGPAPAGSNRSALLIVFLVVFIDLLGFGIVLPVLPVIGDEYVGAILPGGRQNPLSGAIDGALMAAFSLMQFLFAPIWGRVSDRV